MGAIWDRYSNPHNSCHSRSERKIISPVWTVSIMRIPFRGKRGWILDGRSRYCSSSRYLHCTRGTGQVATDTFHQKYYPADLLPLLYPTHNLARCALYLNLPTTLTWGFRTDSVLDCAIFSETSANKCTDCQRPPVADVPSLFTTWSSVLTLREIYHMGFPILFPCKRDRWNLGVVPISRLVSNQVL